MNIDTLKTKTFWLGLVTLGYGIYECVQGDYSRGATEIQAGLAMIFVRDALTKLAG